MRNTGLGRFGFLLTAVLFFPLAFSRVAAGEDPAPASAAEAAEGENGFSFDAVVEMAAALAKKPYRDPAKADGGQPEMLDMEQWDELNRKLDTVLWDDADHPFFVKPLPTGYIFPAPLAMHVVDRFGKTTKLSLAVPAGEAGDALLPEDGKRQTAIGGFSFGRRDGLLGDAELVRQGKYLGTIGSGHMMLRGRKASQSCLSRTTMLNTVSAADEVNTAFREIWLVEPDSDDTTLVCYALLDSPAVTGALRFEIVPGVTTVTHVRERLFWRANAPFPEKIGIAPLASMFLFSETRRRPANDYRPEVHNSDGLLCADGDGWIWRPFDNPERLLVTSFPSERIAGFGLLQRDDNFDHYQDMDMRFEQSSSVWVEIDGGWGKGDIELVEIPGTLDSHTNILAYWVPDMKVARARLEAGGSLALSYRLYWMPPGITPHGLGRVENTRMSRTDAGDSVTFVVDFAGGELNRIDADMGITSVVEVPEQVTLAEKKVVRNPVTGEWRLFMTFTLPHKGVLQSLLNVRDGTPRLRFAARLKRGENISEPLTETWVYTLTP